MINKKNKASIAGGIMTFLAIVMLITAIFFGARRFFQFINKHSMKPHMPCMPMWEHKMMEGDTLMFTNDSTLSDSCIRIEKKVIIGGPDGKCPAMKCDKKSCDPAQCKHTCKHK